MSAYETRTSVSYEDLRLKVFFEGATAPPTHGVHAPG